MFEKTFENKLLFKGGQSLSINTYDFCIQALTLQKRDFFLKKFLLKPSC